jgi:hypothetical protein
MSTRFPAAIAIVMSLAAALAAQETNTPGPVEHLQLTQASQRQLGLVNLMPPIVAVPDKKRFGILTLTAPDQNGEIISMRVPVGELASRGVRAIASARQQHAERKARAEVSRALQEFQLQQSPRQ